MAPGWTILPQSRGNEIVLACGSEPLGAPIYRTLIHLAAGPPTNPPELGEELTFMELANKNVCCASSSHRVQGLNLGSGMLRILLLTPTRYLEAR